MTKIAIAGDWHANLAYARSAVEYAKLNGATAIYHVGDFGYNFEDKFLDGLNDMLDEQGIYLHFVDGNHENFDVLNEYPLNYGFRSIRPMINHLPRGFRWEIEGTSFLALGGAQSIDKDWRTPGESWWFQETLTFEDVEKAITGGHADVMICHDVPSSVPIKAIENNPMGWPAHAIRAANNHREMLQAVVDEVKPKIIFSGHYHSLERHYVVRDDYAFMQQILDCDGSKFSDNIQFLDLQEQ